MTEEDIHRRVMHNLRRRGLADWINPVDPDVYAREEAEVRRIEATPGLRHCQRCGGVGSLFQFPDGGESDCNACDGTGLSQQLMAPRPNFAKWNPGT